MPAIRGHVLGKMTPLGEAFAASGTLVWSVVQVPAIYVLL